jgi:hypothetical protein
MCAQGLPFADISDFITAKFAHPEVQAEHDAFVAKLLTQRSALQTSFSVDPSAKK